MLLQNLNHIFWNRNGSLRAFSFGLCQNQLCFCKSIYTLNPLNGFFDGQNPFSQVNILPLQSTQFAKARGEITDERFAELIAEINTILEKIEKILEDKERLQWFASKVVNIKDAFFIGRGIDYAIGMEGSLKLKEISYIHSEAYAAGELKHGPISLIEDGTVVFSVVTQSALYEKTISNMVEVKSRGAKLFGLTTYGNYNMEDVADFTVYIPKIDNLFAGSLAVIPLQLLSYYVSVGKGFDVDKPRNLAKSVTVE